MISRARALVTLVTLAVAGCAKPPTPSEFSVILVTLDTTRADRIGAWGGTVPTPHLDAVAAQGVRFETAISQVPLTLPAHSSILTGKYPAAHGVRHNGIFKLQDSDLTLAERFREAGFQTAAFIGAFVLNHPFGTAQGFDTYDDIATPRHQGGRESLYEAQRTADQVNARFFEWLEHRGEGRFFAWIHYYDPHLPYSPPETDGRVLTGAGYDREISYVDACFGDLVARLGRDGLLDRSVLVVAGDHGESLGEHREVSHGVFLYEGAMHVPMIIRAPGLLPAGKTVRGVVELVDIAPTLLDLLGLVPLPASQGRSLMPRIRGDDDGRAALAYAETQMPRLDFGWADLAMVRDGRFKYIRAPRAELYDLREDPKELHNLLDREPERGAEMAALLESWRAATTDVGSQDAARHALTAEEEAKLRSLGYLGGAARAAGPDDSLGLPDPKDRIEEGRLITEARDHIQQGRAEEALLVLDRIVGGNPLNQLAHTSRVQALLQLKRLPAAEEAALATLAAASADPHASAAQMEKARRVLASVYWMVGKNQEAEQQYRLAIELNRTNAAAPVFPGILLGAAGGMEEAMRIVRDVLERDPNDGMALAARFELELARRETEAALATSRRLAELRAGDADTLFKAGKLARESGDAELAAVLFEVAGDKKPDDPDILGYLGTARLAAGDLDGAKKALAAVRRLRPTDPRAPFYLGNIALLHNDERQARELFAEAVRLDAQFTTPLLNLARWLHEKQRSREAADVVREALERKPDDPEAKQLLQQLQAAGAYSSAASQ